MNRRKFLKILGLSPLVIMFPNIITKTFPSTGGVIGYPAKEVADASILLGQLGNASTRRKEWLFAQMLTNRSYTNS